MPRKGVEQERRAALVAATIGEIGRAGTLDVTVSQIARRAGVSSALAHHYLGSKDEMFLLAMRKILADYAAEVRRALTGVTTSQQRLTAIIEASFAPSNFQPETIGAWLMFYLSARRSPEAARLLRVYHRRLHSNLLAGLRPLLGPRAPAAADSLAALIDGLYLRQGLAPTAPDPQSAITHAKAHLTALLSGQPTA